MGSMGDMPSLLTKTMQKRFSFFGSRSRNILSYDGKTLMVDDDVITKDPPSIQSQKQNTTIKGAPVAFAVSSLIWLTEMDVTQILNDLFIRSDSKLQGHKADQF